MDDIDILFSSGLHCHEEFEIEIEADVHTMTVSGLHTSEEVEVELEANINNLTFFGLTSVNELEIEVEDDIDLAQIHFAELIKIEEMEIEIEDPIKLLFVSGIQRTQGLIFELETSVENVTLIGLASVEKFDIEIEDDPINEAHFYLPDITVIDDMNVDVEKNTDDLTFMFWHSLDAIPLMSGYGVMITNLNIDVSSSILDHLFISGIQNISQVDAKLSGSSSTKLQVELESLETSKLELIGDLLLRGNGDVKVSINGACGTVQSARLEASSSALVMNSMGTSNADIGTATTVQITTVGVTNTSEISVVVSTEPTSSTSTTNITQVELPSDGSASTSEAHITPIIAAVAASTVVVLLMLGIYVGVRKRAAHRHNHDNSSVRLTMNPEYKACNTSNCRTYEEPDQTNANENRIYLQPSFSPQDTNYNQMYSVPEEPQYDIAKGPDMMKNLDETYEDAQCMYLEPIPIQKETNYEKRAVDFKDSQVYESMKETYIFSADA
eukprot:gene6032-9137_t